MSRIAKSPIEIPDQVNISREGKKFFVKGPRGELYINIHHEVEIEQKNGSLYFAPTNGNKTSLSMSGTTRALVFNMVQGVTIGFEKRLKLTGVGYRAQKKGKKIQLSLGYSHQINYDLPESIEAEVIDQTEIKISGIDKQLVGQTAAQIRDFRRPEPYKGKGVSYVGERIYRKEAKKK